MIRSRTTSGGSGAISSARGAAGASCRTALVAPAVGPAAPAEEADPVASRCEESVANPIKYAYNVGFGGKGIVPLR